MFLDENKLRTIEIVATRLATDVYSALSEDEMSEQTQLATIEGYINTVRQISDYLDSLQIDVIPDICNELLQGLCKLQDKKKIPNQSQWGLLEQWPTVLMALITDEGDINNFDELLKIITNSEWITPLNESIADELRNQYLRLYQSLKENTASDTQVYISDSEVDLSGEEGITLAYDLALFVSVEQELLDTMGVLFNDLDTKSEDKIITDTEALYLCATRIETLGLSCANAGLMGLLDVCQYFQLVLKSRANDKKIVAEDERHLLEEFRSYAVAYAENPTDVNCINDLVGYLIYLPWLEDFNGEEAEALKELLLPEQIEITEDIQNDSDYEDQIDSLIDASIDKAELIEGNETFNDAITTELTQTNQKILVQSEITEENNSYSDDILEIIELVKMEIEANESDLRESLLSATDICLDHENKKQALQNYFARISIFEAAAESVALNGLACVFTHMKNNLGAIINLDYERNTNLINRFKKWPMIVLAYLNDINDVKLSQPIVDYITESNWPINLSINPDQLLLLLSKPDFSSVLQTPEDRQQTATVEDVSLQLPQDVNQQLLDSLLQELPTQTAEFAGAVAKILNGDAGLSDLDKAQRIAHTLKGSANTVGVTGIATLTHHVEEILQEFSKHNKIPGTTFANVLVNVADVLEMMSESLLGIGEVPQQSQSVLQEVLDWANRIDESGLSVEGVASDGVEKSLEFNSQALPHEQSSDTSIESTAQPMLRIPANLVDDLLRLVGESIILTGQLQERLNQALANTQTVKQHNIQLQQLTYDLEQLVDVQGIASSLSRENVTEEFDRLELDQYNELHTVTRRLVEASTDAKELTQGVEDQLESIDSLLIDQNRLHSESQKTVMQTRMVPVQNIVPRLQRSIRQTCRLTDKQANLEITGGETFIDSDVLNDLTDPLMHILRNAVDHGIETSELRTQKGKNSIGKIDLGFYREGDHIVVRCEDDGLGLDFNIIRKTAIERGLVAADESVTEEELSRLILRPGFTTKTKTTQVSGRGIGMDAVYTKILTMKGGLSVTSEANKGCVVEFRLPLTLMSVHALLVKTKKQKMAISTRGVEQILYADMGKLISKNESLKYHLNEETCDAFYLESLLHLPVNVDMDKCLRPVLMVRDDSGKLNAILVEHVIASQDLVVKQLGQFVPNIVGIEGATILGDGSIAPVIDLPGLLRTLQHTYVGGNHSLDLYQEEIELPRALIVDDSLSARRSLEQFVADLGYEVLSARDGLEAIEVIQQKNPDILLVDLEMPRMNGLELTSHVRAHDTLSHIPIIMVTSRSTDKHKRQAQALGVNVYLTKPYSEDELLEQIQSLMVNA